MMKIFLGYDNERLQASLDPYSKTGAVEAGPVNASVISLDHHGDREGEPAPCVNTEVHADLDAIAVSHIDLDTLGGLWSLMGIRPGTDSFWELAAFCDVNGAHRIDDADASSEDIAHLWAWWCYEDGHPVYAERDGSVRDVAETVEDLYHILQAIFADDQKYVAAGQKYFCAQETLNAQSFVGVYSNVVIRVAPEDSYHLYAMPEGYRVDGEPRSRPAKACVAYDTRTGAINIALADAIPGVSCVQILTELFGPESGGRDTVAGGPRGVPRTLDDIVATRDRLIRDIKAAS
jgi:hypothetical protein